MSEILSKPFGFNNERQTVCVQGLGFVGSAMSLAVSSAKDNFGDPLYNVIGVELDNEQGRKRVDSINNGVFPFENNDENLQRVLRNAVENKNLWATVNPEYFSFADVIIVDVNLDINYKKKGGGAILT